MKNHALSANNEGKVLPISISLLGEKLSEEKEALLVSQLGCVRYRDAYRFRFEDGDAWLFDYGVLVCWNVSEDERMNIYRSLESIIISSDGLPLLEQYRYEIKLSEGLRIHNDCLLIPNDSELNCLALSHAFAQSAKLNFFEEKAQAVIQKNSHISKQLALSGKVPLSRLELAKLRGVLFDTSSDITLHFNLLDTPEFFWDYPELESYYQALAKYLDLNPRIEILNKKLNTIQGLLDMLAAEQYHKHSAFLEWVIIWLIAVDIIIYFV